MLHMRISCSEVIRVSKIVYHTVKPHEVFHLNPRSEKSACTLLK